MRASSITERITLGLIVSDNPLLMNQVLATGNAPVERMGISVEGIECTTRMWVTPDSFLSGQNFS
jgi:hypothetical protein